MTMCFLLKLVVVVVTPAAAAVVGVTRCQCVPGPAQPASVLALEQGNAAFAADLPLLRAAVQSSNACGRRLWREAFILSASWEGNHEALGRYARADLARQPYFVVPTPCAAAACIDHRCDWAKNAMLDAEMLVAVAHAAVLAGRHDPLTWFTAEELLGNWAELAVDRSNNDKVWTYCPTSYNPVAPWHTRNNNMTLLPQMVWVDLPANFSTAAANLNCSFVTPGALRAATAPRVPTATTPPPRTNKSCDASAASISQAFGVTAADADAIVDGLVLT
jgi:hypothetical protein